MKGAKIVVLLGTYYIKGPIVLASRSVVLLEGSYPEVCARREVLSYCKYQLGGNLPLQLFSSIYAEW